MIGLLLVYRLILRPDYLTLDEAEQAYVANDLSLGYANQPPLYFWLQHLFFYLFGTRLFSIALLKACLLSACLIFYKKTITQYSLKSGFACCALVSWALMPAIGMDLLKDNTHSVLALLAACMTAYYAQKLSLQRLDEMVSFGVILGIGLLSKFNYLLFFLPFVLSHLPLWPRKKRVGIVVAFLIAVILATPYYAWLYHHPDVGLHTAYKLVPTNKTGWHGFEGLIKSLCFFLLPLLVVSFCFFPAIFRPTKTDPQQKALIHYHLFATLFLLVLVVGGGLHDFETRWLIPIYFITPILLFSRLQSKDRTRMYLLVCGLVQIIYCLLISTPDYWGKHHRLSIPVKQLVDMIPPESESVVSNSVWILGNVRMANQKLALQLLIKSPLPTRSHTFLIMMDNIGDLPWTVLKDKNGRTLFYSRYII